MKTTQNGIGGSGSGGGIGGGSGTLPSMQSLHTWSIQGLSLGLWGVVAVFVGIVANCGESLR